ncbi:MULTISPECIES: C39 family peptidase [Bhargavaea]|uniref:C39 family peptidase n=1 Tax=Bhargavaea changchunensis TaxID=2134037 RepID=A0ABW2NFD6_9BACL|nr:C39 family peptidase [Bhargavaea sp. CC-171006]
MSLIESFRGKSQYDPDIDPAQQNSACGPVTAYTMIGHLLGACPLTVSDLYRSFGGTPLGLSVRKFIRGASHMLGTGWAVRKCTLDGLKEEILAGRPVAAKFDKWFSFRWFGKYTFAYHWVPVVGYSEESGDIILIIHDNGGRGRPSRIRRVPYSRNRPILTFVRMTPVR